VQYCDSTCSFCAREFFAWWRARAFAGRYRVGRSGGASFDAEAKTSREKSMSKSKAEILAVTVRDLVAKLVYYDRKEDEELSRDDVDDLIESGTVTVCDIVETFRDELLKVYPE
jgi:uncharacterized protein YuzB (UPF0349 family)